MSVAMDPEVSPGPPTTTKPRGGAMHPPPLAVVAANGFADYDLQRYFPAAAAAVLAAVWLRGGRRVGGAEGLQGLLV